MNRKRMLMGMQISKLLLRVGSLVLAALMVFGNLILPGGIFAASAEETAASPTVYWSEDFEGFTLTDGAGNVTDWTQVGNVFTVATDTTNGDNQVLRLFKDTTGNTVIKSPAQTGIGKAAVLEYDLYFPVGASVVYPLTLMSGTTWGGVQLALEGSGIFRRDGGSVTYATLEQGKTHNIKLAADIENNCWYLWINGSYIPVEDNTLTKVDTLADYTGCLGGTPSGGVFTEGTTGIYYDNIKISQYIRATSFGLTETEATLKVNETKQLTWTFAPANATDNGVVFESNAETVATVDSKGLITAVAEGTAVITATPANGMAAQSITVTVEDDQPEVYWSENFEGDKSLQDRGFVQNGSATWGNHFSVAAEPGEETNQVMLVHNTGSNYIKKTVFDASSVIKKAVLEYRVYLGEGAATVYLPTFMNEKSTGIIGANLVMTGAGSVHLNGAGDTIFTTLAVGKWHDVKMVADAEAGKWYLWIDDAYLPIANNTYTGSAIAGVIVGAWKTAVNSNVYYDDLVLSEYIPATGFELSKSETTLGVGATEELSWSFAPETASLNAVSFSSDDPDVATVNSKGVITAVGAGTATITATAVCGVGTDSVEVTVQNNETVSYYTEDFEHIVLGEDGTAVLPSPWTYSSGTTGFRVIKQPNEENQVLEVYLAQKESANRLVRIPATAAVKQIVMEYDLYYTDGAQTMFPLTLMKNSADGGYAMNQLVLETSGLFRTNDNQQLAILEKNKTYTIRVAADVDANAWYIWINDVFIPLTSNKLISGTTGFTGGIIGTYSATVPSGIYFDNIKFYAPVAATKMTVEESSITLDPGDTKELTVKYEPAATSMAGATFSSSNSDVATVDGTGKITAVAEGNAVITVTPIQSGLDEVEVNVTVNPLVVLPESYIQDFDDVTVGTMMPEMQVINDMGSNGTVAIIADPEDTDNHILTLGKIVASGNVQFRVKSGTFAAADKMVLEYKIKTTENCTFYPMTLRTEKDDAVRLVVGGGYLQYQNMSNTNVVIAQLSNNEWHTIKLVVDAVANVWYVYLDGSYMPVEDNSLRSAETITWALTRSTGGSLMPSVYFDDISITPYVNGQSVSAQPAITVNANVPTKLELVFEPANTSVNSADFASSNTEILTVDANGYITGWSAGTATVTVDPHQPGLESFEVQVTVNVIDISKIEIQPDNLSLPVGGHTYLSVVATPADASFTDVVFTSSDERVATVDEYGEVVALKAGTVTLTATSASYPTISDSITLTVSAPAVMDTIYVASNGKADAAGTAADPVNLQGALTLIAARNDNMTGNIEVVLAGGYYYLSETLKITEAHSGTNNYSVVWKAAAGETPVIGSAYTVSGTWTKDEATGIYSVDVPEWLDSRQLFVNNVRATRARSEGGLTNCSFLTEGGKEIGYISKDVELAGFAAITDLELVFKEEWTQPRIGVTSIQDNGNGTVNIVLDQPGFGYIQAKGQTKAKGEGPVWIENALELLNEPGEWYLDTANNKLYYMPRAWENMANAKVTMPVLDQDSDGALVQISGASHDQQVQNIHFEGITFADTTWLRPNSANGHADVQNNHIRESKDTLQPAAVIVKKANSVWFTGCTFTRLGITGLQMLDGVQNSFIIGNHFFDISGSAINIGDPAINAGNAYAQGNAMMKNNDILNNYIHNIGVDYGSAAAISVGFAADMDMNHNEMFAIPYSGWHIGYGWNNRFPNNNKNMLLEYNFIHDYMGEGIYDGGGIYVLGNTSGDGYNIARYNYFRNQMAAHGAMYPDQGTTYFEFIENVVDFSEVKSWHAGLAPRWMLTNQVTEHIHFINNYTTTSSYKINDQVDQVADDVTITGLVVDPEAKWEGTNAQSIMAAAGLESKYATLRNGQAERILVNIPDNGLELDVEQAHTLSVSFTDGKDSSVDGGEVILAYDVADPTVATVSESGVITAVNSGITTLRIWVVSNKIQTIVERQIIVAEGFRSLVLEGVEDAISMSINAEGKTIKATILTTLNRALTPDSVSAEIADARVAVVTEEGVLKPVSEGTTTVTVTAVRDGMSITAVFKVVISAEVTMQENNLWEIFDKEKEDTWVKPGANTWELVDDTSITAKVNGFATFTGAVYGDELLSFRLKIDKSTGGGEWPAIVLRAQGSESYVSGGVNGYILCMGTNGLELYRFTDGIRHVFYGNFKAGDSGVDATQKLGDALTGSKWSWDENVAEHHIQFGAVADGDDVRLILIVDGEEVINCVDKAEHGALTNAGYFGIIGRGETWVLTKDTTITDEEPKAQIGEKQYASLDDAMKNAVTGDTVQLLADAEAKDLVLTKGVTLDLNGYNLTTEYLVAFAGNAVTDSANGVGLLCCKNVRLDADNPMLPVWDEAAGGYRFFNVVNQRRFDSQDADGFVFYTRPLLGAEANSIFMSQTGTNQLSFKIRMRWGNTSSNDVEQLFSVNPTLVANVYSQYGEVVMLKVSGAGPYAGNLLVDVCVKSETGVVWTGKELTYKGE